MAPPGETISPLVYHDTSKHTFGRFARSLGYLDWATQPNPFRRFAGSPLLDLPRVPVTAGVPYTALFTSSVPAQPISHHTVGEFLRCSLGLSAWKSTGRSRWALRVNPSSGNLHPTEAYLVWDAGVYHYAPAEHALEQRAALARGTWRLPTQDGSGTSAGFLVALTSIHWREAWKYGERAFRYCQHDTGHALGALRLSAAMFGWSLTLLARWSHSDMATTLGLDRHEDFGEAERETPELIALVSCGPTASLDVEPATFVEASRRAEWRGRANVLSSGRVAWPMIDAVAATTADPGGRPDAPVRRGDRHYAQQSTEAMARNIILQRRSATAFSPAGVLHRSVFLRMLARLVPSAPPWDVRDWTPDVHLVLFVHRVHDMTPGIYAFMRADDDTRGTWQAMMRSDFLWEPVASTGHEGAAGLFLLAPLDVRGVAKRLSCDQDIAGDGFFSLAMVANMGAVEGAPWRYRQRFWECGLIGQVLYLEAEAAGGRATGIGCFYDDPVHELLGLGGDGWQSLYHFSMGAPLEDSHLTTEPGYAWEMGSTNS